MSFLVLNTQIVNVHVSFDPSNPLVGIFFFKEIIIQVGQNDCSRMVTVALWHLYNRQKLKTTKMSVKEFKLC